jgi:hypothetical protein
MKKTNFAKQLQEASVVTQKATKFIENAPLEKGQTLQFYIEDEDDINEMPTVTRVDKHNCYDEFGVVAVSKPEDKVLIHLKGKGEASDETKVFPITELGAYYSIDDYYTCLLADFISEKLQ